MTEQRLDLIQKNPRHRRDDVIDEMRRSLRHVPPVAGRAHAPSLAREGDDEPLRALCAERAGKPETEQPAREIAAELLFDVARDVLLAGRAVLVKLSRHSATILWSGVFPGRRRS
jgi:hypothetical protein